MHRNRLLHILADVEQRLRAMEVRSSDLAPVNALRVAPSAASGNSARYRSPKKDRITMITTIRTTK
jgi:hypothetical protein